MQVTSLYILVYFNEWLIIFILGWELGQMKNVKVFASLFWVLAWFLVCFNYTLHALIVQVKD